MLRLFDRLNLTPAERRLVVAIAAVVFVVLNYWLVWPRFGDFRAIGEAMDSMQRKRDLYEREIARRPVYEATLKKLQAEGSVLPAGEERIQFRSDMERMARESELNVPRWGEVLPERSSGSTTNAFFEAIGLTMNQVTGTEGQFVDFLYRVGASNSTIRVKELSLVPGNFDQRAQGKTNLVATIKLVASVQKSSPKTVLPAVAPTASPASVPASPTAAGPTVGTNLKASTKPSPVPAPSPSSAGSGRTNVPPPRTTHRTNLFPIPGRMSARTNPAVASPKPEYAPPKPQPENP